MDLIIVGIVIPVIPLLTGMCVGGFFPSNFRMPINLIAGGVVAFGILRMYAYMDGDTGGGTTDGFGAVFAMIGIVIAVYNYGAFLLGQIIGRKMFPNYHKVMQRDKDRLEKIVDSSTKLGQK